MNDNHLQSGDYVTTGVRLLRLLAEGGMGRVWIAEHLGLQTQVVVKLMAPEMAERADGRERFAREAAACAAIKSPHVVQVFDHGVVAAGPAEGTPYMVMELLEGTDLGAYLAEHGRMDPMDVVSLVVQVGKALSKAHKASIVHRDIKPENIFLCEAEGGGLFVKLLDFGTARRDREAVSRTTLPGQIMGTPFYMSPEQSVGASEIDERSDIWSLGVVAFEAFTGQRPFDGASVGAITIAIHGALPKITALAPDLPPALDAWFARACAQTPRERFASARDATNALVSAVTGASPIDPLVTEPVSFPPPASRKAHSVPVARPVEPLVASLPKRGAEKRVPTIAAGLVMAAAAAAMVAIVVDRPPAPVALAETVRVAEVQPPEPEPEPVEPAAPAPAPMEPAAPSAGEDRKTASAGPAARPRAVSRAAETARGARVKASKARGARRSTVTEAPKGAPRAASEEGLDDDLVRLSNAASKHAQGAAPETPETPETPVTPPQEPLPPPTLP